VYRGERTVSVGQARRIDPYPDSDKDQEGGSSLSAGGSSARLSANQPLSRSSASELCPVECCAHAAFVSSSMLDSCRRGSRGLVGVGCSSGSSSAVRIGGGVGTGVERSALGGVTWLVLVKAAEGPRIASGERMEKISPWFCA
jgi:hypothetical protein